MPEELGAASHVVSDDRMFESKVRLPDVDRLPATVTLLEKVPVLADSVPTEVAPVVVMVLAPMLMLPKLDDSDPADSAPTPVMLV